MSSAPTIDNFAEILSEEAAWYDFGIFLGVSTRDLDLISKNHGSEGSRRCMIEIYKCVQKQREPLTWVRVVDVLTRLKNYSLADKIERNFMMPSQLTPDNVGEEYLSPVQSQTLQSEDIFSQPTENPPQTILTALTNDMCSQSRGETTFLSSERESDRASKGASQQDVIKVPNEICRMFTNVTGKFTTLTAEVIMALRKLAVHPDDLQRVIEDTCDLEPLPEEDATLDRILKRLPSNNYHFLDVDTLETLTSTFLRSNDQLRREIEEYKSQLEKFKSLSEIQYLVNLVKARNNSRHRQKEVVLKLREFWKRVKLKKFESAMQEIFETLYDCTSHITAVSKGCICVSWIVPPEKATTKLTTPEPEDKEFIRVIGVKSLRVGDSTVYDIQGEGCETIEAAMLQAIELENKRAIEILLLLGCDPEAAAHYEGVTNIVNIFESGKIPDSVKHICVFGHNENIEAILHDQQNVAEEKEEARRNLHEENCILRLALEKKGEM